MTTKRDLDRLIDAGDAESIREAAQDPGRSAKLVRRILARLYSRDPAVKWRAVAALGVAAAEDVLGEERARELVKRFTWALNDESGAVPFGIPEALGEVIAVRPLFRPVYTPLLVSYLVHDELIQTGPILAGAIWALGRAGVEDAEDRQRALPGLQSALALDETDVRGAALWSVSRLGLAHALEEAVRARLGDEATVTLLVDGAVEEHRLADLAREALGGPEADSTLAP